MIKRYSGRPGRYFLGQIFTRMWLPPRNAPIRAPKMEPRILVKAKRHIPVPIAAMSFTQEMISPADRLRIQNGNNINFAIMVPLLYLDFRLYTPFHSFSGGLIEYCLLRSKKTLPGVMPLVIILFGSKASHSPKISMAFPHSC